MTHIAQQRVSKYFYISKYMYMKYESFLNVFDFLLLRISFPQFLCSEQSNYCQEIIIISVMAFGKDSVLSQCL